MNTRFKLIRKNQGMTQQAMAEALNVSKSTIEGYEYGRLNITDRTIADVCRLYNVSEEWLRTGKGEMFKPLSKEAEIAIIAAQMLKEDSKSIRTSFYKVISQMTDDELALMLEWAKKIVEMNEQ